MITVDSRGCGEGKTTTHLYPKLKQLILDHQRAIIVVPGIKLQEQYQRQFPFDTIVINSENRKQSNPDERQSVVARTFAAMLDPKIKLIIITSACFKLFTASVPLKSGWHLIIDEAIDPFRPINYFRKNSTIDWTQVIKSAGPLVGDFMPVEIDENNLDSIAASSETIRMLLDPNWITHVTVDTFNHLQQNTGMARASFNQQLDPEVMKHWLSVTICAAAFDYHLMADWMKSNKIEYTVTHPFDQRQLPIRIHSINRLDWSKTKQDSEQGRIWAEEYRNYVNDDCERKNQEPLAVRNNNVDRVLQNELRLNHNPHGLNSDIYTSKTAISLESALNPTKEFQYYLTEFVGMEKEAITRAFSSYLFYQCLMRTALRLRDNKKVVDLYILDAKSGSAIMDFVIPIEGFDIPSSYVYEAPLTPAERTRLHRLRKRAEELSKQSLTKDVTIMHKQLYENRYTPEPDMSDFKYMPRDPADRSHKEARLQEMLFWLNRS